MTLSGISLWAPSMVTSPALAGTATVRRPTSLDLKTSFACYTRLLALVAGLNGCGTEQANRPQVVAVPDQPPVAAENRKTRLVESTTQSRVLYGSVVGGDTRYPIRNVLVEVELEGGRHITLTTDSEGKFLLEDVPAGRAEFEIVASGYRSLNTAIEVAMTGPISAEFEMVPLPPVGSIEGWVTEAGRGSNISDASVRIVDILGRSLTITADTSGAFSFTSVPPGVFHLWIDAPGYISAVRPFEAKPNGKLQVKCDLMKRPAVPNISVKGSQLQLKRPVQFEGNSSEVKMAASEFDFIMDELADYLKADTKGRTIELLEIRGHTAESFPNAKRVSKHRAAMVREALELRGVDESRLQVTFHGSDLPLVPNTSDANRAKNNRVDFVIKKSRPVPKTNPKGRDHQWIM